MGTSKKLFAYNKYYAETGAQSLAAPSGTYEQRISIEANQTHGILTLSEIGSGFVQRLGGVYFITTDEDDAVGASTRFIGTTISSGSGTSGGSYTFYVSRPEIFNFQDDDQVGTTSYGNNRTPTILLDSAYIDTATDEAVLLFATSASSGNYPFNAAINLMTYRVQDGS